MIHEIKVCPGTLKEGHSTYSSICRKRMFFNKKVDHILPYDSPSQSEEANEQFIENKKRISISGVQEKQSLTLQRNKLRLTKDGEQGKYILKPIPRDLRLVNQVPANEHLTMQIASQIYGINTAANALIFFQTGEPAYLTKRFDVKDDDTKWGTEDFGSLSNRTKESHGESYKYENISYEDIAELIAKYVGAYQVEIEKFYKLILFNYLFSNGDAHLKNFSLLETISGDYILSPAYDLLNTRIHVADTFFALKTGLFKDGSVRNPTSKDFKVFGKTIGIKDSRLAKIYDMFLSFKPEVEAMIQKSFLNKKAKKGYLIHYNTRFNVLEKS